MAGMFYSLQEAAEKLNKTEEQVKEFVKEGKLREFRDGSNLLFKIDEVEALVSDAVIMQSEETRLEEESPKDEGELLLETNEDEDTATGSELTNADTAAGAEGIDILEETEDSFNLGDDTISADKAETGEASLEEIEDDINLDTFGSGSGLLDLSLQADDTSLGGILDEIYTPEENNAQLADETPSSGSTMSMATGTGQMLSEEDFGLSQSAQQAAAVVQTYAEPQPDTLSNALGVMLFLPLLAVIYTAVVVVAGLNGTMPAILEKSQDIIWYIAAGAAVVAILLVAAASLLSSNSGKTRKSKKAKQQPEPSEDLSDMS
ncbi:MAG: helix-turn-helix domain-containing protein [Planctomycetes bacterium]|nr:helix-turn-helix domain-containing protein [Planctomycetota bacterium]